MEEGGGFLQDPFQVGFPEEAFRVDLGHVLGAAWAHGEPGVGRHHLDPAQRLPVARGPVQDLEDGLPGEGGGMDLLGGEPGQAGLGLGETGRSLRA